MTGLVALLAAVVLQAGIADMGQISAPAAETTGMVQAAPAAERRQTGAAQLSDRDRAPNAQVQVATGGRTAAPPPALSSAADGRRINAGPIGGADGCDPAARGRAPAVDCSAIIETRATEFARLAPPEPDSSRPPQTYGDEETADGVARRLAQGQATGATAEAVAGGRTPVSQPPPQAPVQGVVPAPITAYDISTQAVVEALVSQLTAAGAAGITVTTAPH